MSADIKLSADEENFAVAVAAIWEALRAWVANDSETREDDNQMPPWDDLSDLQKVKFVIGASSPVGTLAEVAERISLEAHRVR